MKFLQDRPLGVAVLGKGDFIEQAVIGLFSGVIMAMLAWAVVASRWMEPLLDRYADIIGPLMPGKPVQILGSVCAGIGEELLFRGALQHWLGIPLTAMLFVALHGYLDPRDRRLLTYGLLITGIMLLFGWHAREHGLVAPMIAHAAFDLVLIDRLVRHWRRRTR
ncbi:MAG: CPBP family intramembrane metalloprotease [Flavobacteriales bacterium]|nr:CPBP family intramembrane metalloprotease [Flavobacteriales bacterium]